MRIIRKTPLAKNRKLGISAFVLPVLLATVFLLPGCNMFNKPLSDFLEYWTDVAQISRHSFDGSYPETDGLTNLPAGADRVITCYVINPQNYVLTPSATFASGSLTQGSDYSIEQDASDRTVLRLTLNDSYLQSLDGTGTGISPTVSITEPNSGRNFGSYSVPLRVNSAPDGVKSPVVLRSGSSPETYILCFNMPDATKANGDIETISVDGNSFNRTYTVDMQNGTISGTGTIYTTKNASWQPVVNGAADFIGDESNRFVGIDTGIPLSGDTVSFTVTTHDSYGLSTSVEAGATASKLEVPTSDPSSGSILQVGDSVTIRHPASSGDNRTLDVHVTDGGEDNVTIVEGTPNAPEVTVTFNATGTYTLSAQAKMTGAADSDEVTFTYTVKRASTVYVSEIGDDDASGTEDKPVETLEKAIKLLNEAQFTKGEIVVTGTVQTGEVIINAQDGTTGSLKTLMVRGGADGGTLENENGRVFTIGSGGSVTLGEGITLTGHINYANARGGAVHVTGGKFTMESGSTIADSSVKGTSASGGGVSVGSGGTFTMNDGAKIIRCQAWDGGGAVYVSGDGANFTMNGGVIGGNSACTNVAKWGGGVYVGFCCEFTMSGNSEISYNMAEHTGSNSTGIHGGGVYFSAIFDSTFTMNDNAEIIYNTCDGSGGGVYVGNSESRFFMNDNARIKYNEAYNGGGVYFTGDGTFTVSGRPDITENILDDSSTNNVTLADGKVITIGSLTGGSIGVTAAAMVEGKAVQITDKNVNNAASIFTSDVEGYRIVGNVEVGETGSTAVFLSDKETSYSTDENGGVSLGDFEEVLAAIKITGGDITVFKPVKIAGDNDMTISTSTGAKINITASGETTVFDVQAGGSLTLGGENSGSVIITGDSSVGNPYNFDGDYSLITVSGGTVNIGENTEIKDNKAGRGVNVTSGNLYMTGGTISGNTGNTNGGGVLVNGASSNFIMSGGEICNNKLEKNSTSDPRQGGGVRVSGGATFTLEGDGKIYSNEARDGGGVGVDGSESTFIMKGGEIYENVATSYTFGGGVYVQSSGKMYMSGGKIYSNRTSGVYLSGSSTFVGSSDADASISTHTGKDISYREGATVNLGNVKTEDPI